MDTPAETGSADLGATAAAAPCGNSSRNSEDNKAEEQSIDAHSITTPLAPAANANEKEEVKSSMDAPGGAASGEAREEERGDAEAEAASRRGGLRRRRDAAEKPAPHSPTTEEQVRQPRSNEMPSRDTISSSQLSCLAAVAYLLGSPLQRRQSSAQDGAVQSSLLLACELLERGVDVERVIELVEARSGFH